MKTAGAVAMSRTKSVGPLATAAWLASRGLYPPLGERWKVTIALDDDARNPQSHLQLTLDAAEWSVRLSRDNKMSWIRVVDIARTQARDDFELIRHVPALHSLSKLVQHIEDTHDMRFRRAHAQVRTNIPQAEDKIRLWVVASL